MKFPSLNSISYFLFFVLISSNNLKAQCGYTGGCNENLICNGGFENVGDNLNFQANIHIYRGTIDIQQFVSGTPSAPNNNSADIVCTICPTAVNPVFSWQIPGGPIPAYCMNISGLALPQPLPPAPNDQYLRLAASPVHSEALGFKIEAPLSNCGSYNLSFDYADVCGGTEIIAVFSTTQPCITGQPEIGGWPHTFGFGSYPTYCGGYTPEQLVKIPLNQTSTNGNIYNWSTTGASVNFTPSINGMEYMAIYAVRTSGVFTLLDNIKLVPNDELEVTKIVTPMSNPCVGDSVTIEYKICNLSGSIIACDIDLEVDIPTGLSVNSNTQDFNLNGEATIPALTLTASGPQSCIELTLILDTNTAQLNNPMDVVLQKTAGPGCFSPMSDTTTIIVTQNDLTINKELTNPANGLGILPGDTVTYTITVTNNGPVTVNGIQFEDVIPNNGIAQLGGFIHVDLLPYSSSSVIRSDFFDLAPGATSQPYSYQVKLDNNLQPCQLIENCAEITAASHMCHPAPKDCEQIYIHNPNPLNPTMGITHASCHNAWDGEINVSHGPGNGGPIIYNLIDNSTGFGSIYINPNLFGILPGSYTLVISDGLCEYSFPITINGPFINGYALTANTSCFDVDDGEILVIPNDGVAPFTYYLNGVLQSSNNFSNLPAGGYTIDVIDANGCQGTFSASIAHPADIIISEALNNISCVQNCDGWIDITVTGGTPPYTFDWINVNTNSSFSTAEDINSVCPGIYTVVVTDANGCTKGRSYEIQAHPDPEVTIHLTPESCYMAGDGSATFSLNPNVTLQSFTWYYNGSPSNISSTFNGISAGTLSIDIIDTNGCVSTASIQIANTPLLTQQAVNIIPPSCLYLNDGELHLDVSGGTPPYSYGITGPGSITSLISPLGFGGLLSGATYTITVTDDNGCQSIQSYTMPTATVIWQKTSAVATGNSLHNDVGNDIVTDSDGNSYVAGTYSQSSSFDMFDIPDPNFAPSFNTGAYLVKYNDCGDLVWIRSASSEVGFSTGLSVTLDEDNGHVYLAGHVSDVNVFTSSSNQLYTTQASTMFLAQYEMTNGDLNLLKDDFSYSGTAITPASTLQPVAISYDGNGGLHMAVNVDINGTDFAMIEKIDIQGSPQQLFFKLETQGGSFATDIVDDNNGSVYMTGHYVGTDIEFFPNQTRNCPVCIEDGFLARFDDGGNTYIGKWLAGLMDGTVNGGNQGVNPIARLNSVDVDGSGHPVVCGQYYGYLKSDFLLDPNLGVTRANFQLPTPLPSETIIIVARVDFDGKYNSNTWENFSVTNGTSGQAKALTVDNDMVYVVGTFGVNSDLDFEYSTNGVPQPYSSSNPGIVNGFLSEFNGSDGDYIRSNSIYSARAVEYNGVSGFDGPFIYSTGFYEQNLDFYYVAGLFPALSTTLGSRATFVARTDPAHPDLQYREDKNAANENIDNFSVYPNPSNGTVFINYSGKFDPTEILRIYSINGQRVLEKTLEQNQALVDLSHLPSGLYLLVYDNQTQKLIVNN